MIYRSLFVILIIVSVFSFAGIAHARVTVENLAQVEELFMEGKYDRVVTESTRLIDQAAHGREELFYLKGLSQIQLTDYRGARNTFEYMIERYPRGKRPFDGYIGMGDAYFLEGKTPESITSYNNALSNYPDHKNSSIAYYKLGNAYQKLGNADKARDYYNRVKNSSPLSFESKMIPDEVSAPKSFLSGFIRPKEEASSRQDMSDYYYVQAGYFKNKDNAYRLNDKLKTEGYESYISTQTKVGVIFYRVKVGRFKTKSEAEAMAGKLKSGGYKTKVCR